MQVFMSPSTLKSERRKKTRNRPPSLVYVELPNGNGGMLRDLSDEGFAVRAMIPLRAGGNTYFAFSLSESVRIEGEGEILWIGENGRVAGVRFTQVSSTARGQIQNWLGEHGEFAEREETAAKPVAPPASTLQQLREEIRSIQMGAESPRGIPEVAAEPIPEVIAAAPEARGGTPSVEGEAPVVLTAPHEDPVLLEITVPLEHADPLENKDSPERTPLPGMTLPGLQAALRGGKRLAHAPEASLGSTAGAALPPVPPAETAPPASEPIRTVPPAESGASDLYATVLRNRAIARAPETRSTTPAPGVPPRRALMQSDAAAPVPLKPAENTPVFPPPRLAPMDLAPIGENTRVEAPPAIPSSMSSGGVSAKPQDGFPSLGYPENDFKSVPPYPALPDISQILIQPPGRRTGYSRSSTVLEPLSSVERLREPHYESWTDRFTLSRAVAIMILLALAGSLYAFHRNVGQSLIWLGEEMGGTQISESLPYAPNEDGSKDPPDGTGANPSNSGSPEVADGETQKHQQGATSDTGVPGENSQGPLSAGKRKALPPVTPLSGLSAPSSSNTGQEQGQAEYSQALEILRGKSSEASQPEVVRLLWISVEKGNLSAELALAEMYWHGQGVARNCDQARILLSAAVRKGSAEARRRLQQLQREGCE